MKLLKRVARAILAVPKGLVRILSLFGDVSRTKGTAAPIRWRDWFLQKCMGFNKEVYWPVHFSSIVSNVNRIKIGVGTAPGLSPGCYIQGINGIEIGDYTIIAPNVGLISASHSLYDLTRHEPSPPIRIGRYCWLGMNVVVLPGVQLGDHTVVAAGAVVTESFPIGYCVLGGVPAEVLKALDRAAVKEHRNKDEYLGFHALNGASKQDLWARLGIEP
jgi:acetyltransferase-like isoleucine patch superfamily enzyme